MAGKAKAVPGNAAAPKSDKKSGSSMLLFAFLALGVTALGGLTTAQVTGVVDVRPTLKNIPYVGPLIPGPAANEKATTGFQQTLEEREINKLKDEKKAVEAKLAQAEAALAEYKTKDQIVDQKGQEEAKQINELKDKIKALEQKREDQKALAKKIALMKPAAAVKILENLPDDMVSSLFTNLDDETVSKLFAAMDPVRVARLSYPDAAKATELVRQKEITKGNYQELAQTLAKMKPEAAVVILEQLSKDMAVNILKEMDKSASGNLLSLMDPTRAAAIVNDMSKI